MIGHVHYGHLMVVNSANKVFCLGVMVKLMAISTRP